MKQETKKPYFTGKQLRDILKELVPGHNFEGTIYCDRTSFKNPNRRRLKFEDAFSRYNTDGTRFTLTKELADKICNRIKEESAEGFVSVRVNDYLIEIVHNGYAVN